MCKIGFEISITKFYIFNTYCISHFFKFNIQWIYICRMCAIFRIRCQKIAWFDLNSAINILIMWTQYLHRRVLISAYFQQENTDN